MVITKNRNVALGASIILITTVILAIGSHPWSRNLAFLPTNPKEVVEEVWQIVNYSYVDGTFNKKDWNTIRKKYVINANYKNEAEAHQAVRKMLAELNDPYTRFMDKKDFTEMQSDNSGKLLGVGLQLTQDDKTKQIVVVAPIDDTPAAKAGIIAQDVILKINGKNTKGLDLNQAVQLMRGEEGTSLLLTVQHGQQVVEHQLRRQQIELHRVKAEYRPQELGGVGYIRLNQFSENATQEMSTAIKKMEARKVSGYVLDLRSNPGGLLYGAIDIAKMWLNTGTIVSTKNRNGGCDQRSGDCKQVANGTALTNKPLVVLVDGGSASSSEILSGALQDNKRARLVGSKTFGKGLVQSVRPLHDGSGLAVTTAKYFTPSGKDINKQGIKPDVDIDLSPQDLRSLMKDRQRVATKDDPQYAKALATLQSQIAAQNPAPTAIAQPLTTVH